jgi:outer membrane lipoprotein-sorting protein
MVKKLFLLFAVAAFVFCAGCSEMGLRGPSGADEISAFERVQRMLMELENYRAIATVEYFSNRGMNSYETVQHAKISGEYRVEVTAPEHVSGSITASDGKQIFQFNSRVNGSVNLMVQETPERSEIFLTSFIKNYLQSEEISVSVSDMEEGVRTVLEANVPGEHPYLTTSRLWVDNETLMPVRLAIFDRDGAERIVVTYHVFEKNVELNDSLFTL